MRNQIGDQARTRGVPEEEIIEKVMLASAAIKRLIDPSEIANLIAFLCRVEASAMSGAPVMIDLGSSAV
jgi:3-hydroxybutyrate dehydrogenase